MTTIKYNENGGTFYFEAEGHAGYAKAGEPDIVCAAVSSFNCLLAELVRRAVYKEPPFIEMKPGRVRIICTPHNTVFLRQQMGVILLGLQMIAEQYPEYVRIENKVSPT